MSVAGRSVVSGSQSDGPETKTSRFAAFARANGRRTLAEIGVNFVAPLLIYNLTKSELGDVRALMTASGPPILWSVIEFIRQRKVDAIAILVLAGIALSLLAFAGGGGVKFLQLRENLVTGLIGLIFLGSVLIGRPLMFVLAKAGAQRLKPQHAASVAALHDDAPFQRAMALVTLAWAAGLLAASALNCWLVFELSIQQFMVVSGPISYATIGGLTVFTSIYVSKAKRAADARRG
jgi:hypothetical protein